MPAAYVLLVVLEFDSPTPLDAENLAGHVLLRPGAYAAFSSPHAR